jgi:hypothetical protein
VLKNLSRFFFYMLGVAALALSLLVLAHWYPDTLRFDRVVAGATMATSELSAVELLQNLLLLFCIGMFGEIARRDKSRRPLAIVFVALFSLCLVRELDFFLDLYLIDNLWQVLSALIFSAAAAYLWRNHKAFVQAWRRIWPSAGLALILGGLILLLTYAQLMGHEPFWQAMMGDSYQRIVKVITEELIELGAYALIAVGTVEFFYAWSRLPRSR